MKAKRSAFPLILLVAIYGCVKDKPQVISPGQVTLSDEHKVFIINEGNFGSSNTSVSLYQPSTGALVTDLYASRNNKPAGDVIQSMTKFNGSYWLVVNNSGKIIRCDGNFQKKGELTGLNSPRYLLPLTNKKAYVSDLGGNIGVLDLNSLSKTAEIKCPGWTEMMIAVYNKVFVTNRNSAYLYVVDASLDKLEDSIFVGRNTGEIFSDKNDKLWVLSSGDFNNPEPARLTRIDPLNNNTELSLPFGSGENPYRLCTNGSRDTLYFLNQDIYRLAVTDTRLPSAPFIVSGGRNYYGLGLNPNDHTVYLSDALDYTQRSNIYVFDAGGKELRSIKAGINANGFYFD